MSLVLLMNGCVVVILELLLAVNVDVYCILSAETEQPAKGRQRHVRLCHKDSQHGEE